jgi:iron complex outermembrane receptor protein
MATGISARGPNQPFPDTVYDHRSFSTLAWNLAMVWKPTGLDTVRISASRGLQSPSLLEYGMRLTSPGLGINGSPYAPTTVVDDYEVGYHRHLKSIATDLDVTAYTQANRSLSSTLAGYPSLFPPTVAIPTAVPTSLGTSHSVGPEISVTTHLNDTLEVGFKYRGAFTGGQLAPAAIDYQTASPRHIATAHVGWSLGRWEADLFARFASSAAGYRMLSNQPTLVTVKDYVTTGANIAYRITPHLSVALEAEDMLQSHQVQSIGLVTERSVYLALHDKL